MDGTHENNGVKASAQRISSIMILQDSQKAFGAEKFRIIAIGIC